MEDMSGHHESRVGGWRTYLGIDGCVCIYVFIGNETVVILYSFWRDEKIDIYLVTVTR